MTTVRAPITFDPQSLIVATGGTLRQTARMLNLDPANLCRPLSSRQADSYATRLGYHPEEIWGAAWNDQDE